VGREEVRGFGVRLSAASGARTYFVQYRVKGTGRQRQITIVRHNDPYRAVLRMPNLPAISYLASKQDGVPGRL
jgi:hypothetical protein